MAIKIKPVLLKFFFIFSTENLTKNLNICVVHIVVQIVGDKVAMSCKVHNLCNFSKSEVKSNSYVVKTQLLV